MGVCDMIKCHQRVVASALTITSGVVSTYCSMTQVLILFTEILLFQVMQIEVL